MNTTNTEYKLAPLVLNVSSQGSIWNFILQLYIGYVGMPELFEDANNSLLLGVIRESILGYCDENNVEWQDIRDSYPKFVVELGEDQQIVISSLDNYSKTDLQKIILGTDKKRKILNSQDIFFEELDLPEMLL